MLLREIANISPGYVFRSRPDYSDKGEYQIIRLQDIRDDNTIDWDALARINLDSVKPDSILKPGDVLFKSRGHAHNALLIESTEGNVITVSQFYIIRPKDSILPEYLAWYINQSKAQRFITQESSGTDIKHVSKQALEKLDIPVPDIEIQRKLSGLFRLSRREKQLVDTIRIKRQALLDAVAMKATNFTFEQAVEKAKKYLNQDQEK